MRDRIQRQMDQSLVGTCKILLQQVLRQHQDLCVRPEALYRRKISDALVRVLLRGHDLEDVERRPSHVMPKHLQVDQLQQRRCLLVHIIALDFLLAFPECGLDVFALLAFVRPQASDELEDILFKHVGRLASRS
jgi:hypothetical protein